MNDRLCPRKKYNCDECGNKIIMKWRNEKMYWSHLPGSRQKCQSTNNESHEHLLAKDLLCEYLKGGNTVIFKKKCISCDNVILNNRNIFFKCEQSLSIDDKKIIFDIGGLDEEGKIIFGIEIMKTHKSENILQRNIIPWVEINAFEIIDKLDKKITPKELFLIDIFCFKEYQYKINFIKKEEEKKLKEEENKLKEEENKLKEEKNFKKCLTCNQQLLKNNKYNNCQKCYILKSNSNYDGKYDNFTLMQIAYNLGYLDKFEKYSCKSRLLLDAAILNNGYSEYDYYFNIEGNDDKNYDLWNELKIRNKCLKCEKNHKIIIYKPFCYDCYKMINKSEYLKDTKYENGKEIYSRKKELFNDLKWIHNIPGNYEYGSKCYYCQKSHIDDYTNEKYFEPNTGFVKSYIWWYGDKKKCCTICLENQMEIRGILKKYNDL